MNEGTMRATTLRLLGSAIGIALLLGLLGAGMAWCCTTYDEGVKPPYATVKASLNQTSWYSGSIHITRGDKVYFKGVAQGTGDPLPNQDYDTINGNSSGQGAGTFIAQWNFKDPDSWGSAVNINAVVDHTFNTRGGYNVLMGTDDTSGTIYNDAFIEAGNIAVYVHDALYEITILEPDGGTIGGITPVRVRVKTRDATLTHLLVKRHEDTTEHSWNWATMWNDAPPAYYGSPPTHIPCLESSSYDSGTGITTDIYRFDWDTTPSHNGNHILYAFGYFSILPTATVSTEDYGGTTVTNLAITSCVPEGVVPWKGEEGTTVPIQVNIEDNDPNDPMTLTLSLYATNADNRGPWTGVRTMTAYNVTGSSYTFYWDGKNDSGEYVEPWTYTFEVDITQTDINYNENPALQVEDATEYRSRYLHILRSRDAFNNPIYEAEYAGYDDGDPNDPNDDSYLYYIRFYDLKDTLDVDASEGELQLYDPDLEQVYTWDVSSLLCLDHEDYDGLKADSTGIMHNLLVPVPVSQMEEGGGYLFVLHMKDDHLDKYRDHRKRWARDLNSAVGIVNLVVEGVAEKDEETPGCFIALNDDDDDSSEVEDRSDTGAVTNEDDLVKITLKPVKRAASNATVTLSLIGDGTKIKVWTSQNRGTTPITLPADYSITNLPKELWVEGFNSSGDLRDTGLKLYTTINGYVYKDIVKFTVVSAKLVQISYVDAGDTYGGDNEYPIYYNSVDYGGWDSGGIIEDPVWVADGSDPGTEPDKNEPVCYRMGTGETSSRMKVDVVVNIKPANITFNLAAIDGSTEYFRKDDQTSTGENQTLSIISSQNLPTTVEKLTKDFVWKVTVKDAEPDKVYEMGTSTQTIYVIYAEPVTTVEVQSNLPTPKRLDFCIVGVAAGQSARVWIADAIVGKVDAEVNDDYGNMDEDPRWKFYARTQEDRDASCNHQAALAASAFGIVGITGQVHQVYATCDPVPIAPPGYIANTTTNDYVSYYRVGYGTGDRTKFRKPVDTVHILAFVGNLFEGCVRVAADDPDDDNTWWTVWPKERHTTSKELLIWFDNLKNEQWMKLDTTFVEDAPVPESALADLPTILGGPN